jgi:gamma-glutamyl-gamma-aminobutyrate hydrolase PuuD
LERIEPDSKWLYDIFGADSLELISTAHHQAIDPERLGAGLTVAATAGDGIIEAVEYRENRFVLGLQWHPERDALADSQNPGIDRRNSNRPLRALVEHAALK